MDNQPRTTVTGTRFQIRAYIERGALVLTNLKSADAGFHYCIIKVYNKGNFRTETMRSKDSYLSSSYQLFGSRDCLHRVNVKNVKNFSILCWYMPPTSDFITESLKLLRES